MGAAFQKQRKYARHRAGGMRVAWKSAGRPVISRADVVGMGGLFLHTSDPLPQGFFIELLFELKTGDFRARASVRDSIPGQGMGVQFVQMQPDDRSRLTQFLSQFQLAAAQPARSVSSKASARRNAPAAETKRSPSPRRNRSVRRCSFVASAEVLDLSSGARLSARVSELAMGGCYVDLLNPLPERTPIKLRIVRDVGVFEAKAKVVYSHPGSGMGLTFTQIAPEHRSILEDWLAEIVTQLRPIS